MIIIGHRGAKDLALENTASSIRKALENRVNAVELDIRVSKDGVCLLHHDPFIIKDLEHEYWISHHTYAQLKRIKPSLTTFEEAIRLVKRRVPIMAEVKPGVPTGPVVEILKKHLAKGWRPNDFILGSFSQSTLEELAGALPKVPMAVTERWSAIKAAHRARKLKTKRICLLQHFLWSGVIFALSKRGFEVFAYPLNDPAKAKRWAKYGLAGVITDSPDLFKNS